MVCRSAVSSTSGAWGGPQQKSNSVHFSLKIWHLVASNLLKGKGSPYLIAENRVPELIPVLGSQQVTSFAAWWTEARCVWTICLRLLPRTGISSGTLCSAIEYGLPLPLPLLCTAENLQIASFTLSETWQERLYYLTTILSHDDDCLMRPITSRETSLLLIVSDMPTNCHTHSEKN